MAGDGYMLNFVSLMQNLSAKVKVDKVDPMYLFNPNSKVQLKDETRLKMTEQEANDWVKTLCKTTRLNFQKIFFTCLYPHSRQP